MTSLTHKEYLGASTLMVSQKIANHAGSRYEGEVSIATGQREGKGKYYYKNSYFSYNGEWLAGQKHGLGRLSFDDGGFYEGDFFRGEITGAGVQKMADGSTYEGGFLKGSKHGEGSWAKADGMRYTGSWAHNKFSGQGELLRRDGSRYVGSFRDHKFHGNGTFEKPGFKGYSYEGSFEAGLRHGFGKLTELGCSYEGEFQLGLKHGTGHGVHLASSVSYSGVWVNDRPSEDAVSFDVGPCESELSYLKAAELLKEEAMQQINGPDPKAAKGKKDQKKAPAPSPDDEPAPPALRAAVGQPLPSFCIFLANCGKQRVSGESGRKLKLSMYKERKVPTADNPDNILRRPVHFGDRRLSFIDPLDEGQAVPAKAPAAAAKGKATPTPAPEDETPPDPGVEFLLVTVSTGGHCTIGGSAEWFLPVHLQPAIYWLRIEDNSKLEEDCWFSRLPRLEFPFQVLDKLP